MPTYTYKREDGTVFDFEQKITDEPLTECPTTGQPVKRVITGGAGLVFKGSGFYLTDYAKSGKESNGSAKEESASSPSKNDSKESSSTNGESTGTSKEASTASTKSDD